MTILEIQTALKARGFDPGELDGAWGRRTIAAVRAFQRANGLDAIGVVGPQTLKALGAAPLRHRTPPRCPPWALRWLGRGGATAHGPARTVVRSNKSSWTGPRTSTSTTRVTTFPGAACSCRIA